MNFNRELIPGVLKARRKRFFADVVLENGMEVVAHCPNPGSMLGSAVPGLDVFIMPMATKGEKTQRKLEYRWVLVNTPQHLICIDTSLSNKIFREALETQQLKEFSPNLEIIAEFPYNESRLDFLLIEPDSVNKACFVEVKSVSMFDGATGFFPDSVTMRGQKHLIDLMELNAQGYRAVLFLMVQASAIEKVCPAEVIDPEYADLLRIAEAEGVELIAYTTEINKDKISLGKRIPVICG